MEIETHLLGIIFPGIRLIYIFDFSATLLQVNYRVHPKQSYDHLSAINVWYNK